MLSYQFKLNSIKLSYMKRKCCYQVTFWWHSIEPLCSRSADTICKFIFKFRHALSYVDKDWSECKSSSSNDYTGTFHFYRLERIIAFCASEDSELNGFRVFKATRTHNRRALKLNCSLEIINLKALEEKANDAEKEFPSKNKQRLVMNTVTLTQCELSGSSHKWMRES